MRYFIKIVFFTLFFMITHISGNAMEKNYLSIELSCRDNPSCIYKKQDLDIEILIKNTSPTEIGFPLKYITRRGPAVMLIDVATQKKMPLRINLAPHALLKEFTIIKPGQSVVINTKLNNSDIIAFREDFVNLIVEISAALKIQTTENEELVYFNDVAKIKIRGIDTFELELSR